MKTEHGNRIHTCLYCQGTGQTKLRRPTWDHPSGITPCLDCQGAGKVDDRHHGIQVQTRAEYLERGRRLNRWA